MTNKVEQFNSIYQQFKDQVYRFCLGFVGEISEADTLFQEVFVRLWSHLNIFKDGEFSKIGVFRIASNTALLYVSRRTRHVKHTSDTALKEIHIDQDIQKYVHLKHNQLFKEISQLKIQDRIVISLFFENCTNQEIAEVVGIKSSLAKEKIHQVKELLIKRLAS